MVSYILNSEVILYVSDEKLSAQFYSALFRSQPDMIAPGMIEFNISSSLKLGLMPSSGIAKIITPILPHPDEASGIPRCELYFLVADVEAEMKHALICGAKLVSETANRNWGDRVGYVADPDGHVIAFAQKISMSMIYLRPFDPLEVNRLIAWVNSPELLVQFSGPGFEFPLTKASWNKHLCDASIHPYFVVDVNSDDPIGYAEIVKINEKEVKLCRLLIGDPELRGLGLGKLVVRELIYEAISITNPKHILLNVYSHNTAAIKCYQAEGFVINASVSKVSLVDGVEWKSYQMDLVL